MDRHYDLSFIIGKERGMIFSELASVLWQFTETGCYHPNSLSIQDQVDSLTITNEQGMEFPLAHEEEDK